MNTNTLRWPGGKYAGRTVTCDLNYLGWVLKSRDSKYLSGWKWQDFFEEHFDDLKHVRVQEILEGLPPVDFILSASQESAATFINRELFAQGSGTAMARLSGGAGYGKSYVLKRVVRDALDAGFMPTLAAPSRVAADNLAAGLAEFGDVRIGTIAAVLRLNKVYDGSRVDYVWCDASDEALSQVLGEGCFFCVDEFSMIDDGIGERLINGVDRYGGVLLVVGDEKQLQPVGQEERSVLCAVEPSTVLDVPMRYAVWSDLYAVEQAARRDPYGVDWEQFIFSTEVHFCGKGRHLLSMVDVIRAHPNQTTLSLHYLTRNVVAANAMIRRELYGNTPPVVAEAESLRIVNTGDYSCDYQMFINGAWEGALEGGGGGSVDGRVYSGKMLTVENLYEGVCMNLPSIEKVIRVIRADVVMDDGVRGVANLLFARNDSAADSSVVESCDFEEALRLYYGYVMAGGGTKELWKEYHAFRDSFIWVQYSYACSIHRVQGMTADNIFFDIGELRGMKDGLAKDGLGYVALTRAAQSLHVSI